MNSSIEKPIKNKKETFPKWGSDVIAQSIRETNVPYITINPGASFRGLHDSIVNYLGNESPKIILCLHEEHAVSIAHGYAKVAEKPLATILHSNVGLMHGSMSIFNAFCDRVPILIFGATGPIDAIQRRPWIDWVHTSQDQAGLIRNFIKWDNQPGSVEASIEAIYRASNIAQTFPKGPVYVCFDVSIQEQKVQKSISIPDYSRFESIGEQYPGENDISKTIEVLSNAKNPIIFCGRVSKDNQGWKNRIILAEKLQSIVFTDRKLGSAFPTNHYLHPFPPVQVLSDEEIQLIKKSDVILSLDWVDLAGTLKQVWKENIKAKIINVSIDNYVHNGWSMDHQGFPPSDIRVLSQPDLMVSALISRIKAKKIPNKKYKTQYKLKIKKIDKKLLSLTDIALTLKKNLVCEDVSFLRLPGGWPFSEWNFLHPLDFLGYDGGGGIGSGPGMSVGSALALRDLFPKRIPISVIGDGDYLMGVNALWTAAHYQIPILIIIANNQSYFNDEMHQDRVAKLRGRLRENRWIGQKIINPEIDLSQLAISQGVKSFGQIKNLNQLEDTIPQSINLVKTGSSVVLDVKVGPREALVIPKNK